ncbi:MULTISPECIES: hypothetical protein [Streptococcus]|uniref:hypothetical protein n=1 Tax=Streptococcus TaxID=1301 RepID=UPI001CB8A6FF|nr:MULTISPECIES: hypothetical protein [Streptococcus]WGK80200.1 hypothetical protein PY824_05425 [Streptococcus macedonicus]
MMSLYSTPLASTHASAVAWSTAVALLSTSATVLGSEPDSKIGDSPAASLK